MEEVVFHKSDLASPRSMPTQQVTYLMHHFNTE
jgi:hypothetical protein